MHIEEKPSLANEPEQCGRMAWEAHVGTVAGSYQSVACPSVGGKLHILASCSGSLMPTLDWAGRLHPKSTNTNLTSEVRGSRLPNGREGRDLSLNASLSHLYLGSPVGRCHCHGADATKREVPRPHPRGYPNALGKLALRNRSGLGSEGIYRACRAHAHLLLVGGFIGRTLTSRGKIKLKPISRHLGGCQARNPPLPCHCLSCFHSASISKHQAL
ncbi:hypothetical protein BDP55DRAFT_50641 [Colletotrichum godetiae]|uniref:Uncharacterized protein n=1 Tax=Colletotrichum godetiae TaxID=1209918 RepID=A0AAJ0EYH6_9PEZI|nr:uncharacterized protein BDP55DRAFT_50641 [Colletotrichum godetiae]KAK1688631.1 hypothetical protein BDP55DRAFT_50641 [Colletotrichum godetiae]